MAAVAVSAGFRTYGFLQGIVSCVKRSLGISTLETQVSCFPLGLPALSRKKNKNVRQRWVKKRKGKKQAQTAVRKMPAKSREKRSSGLQVRQKLPLPEQSPSRGEVGDSGEHHAGGMGLGFWCLRS